MISKNNPDIWERKSGGGCMSIMGLPFLAFTAVGALTFMGVLNNERILNSPKMALLVSTVCLFIGVCLFFVRHGFTIDRKTMEAREWISIIIPLRVTKFDLSNYDHIVLSVRKRKFQSTETIALGITIEGNNDIEPIFIEESTAEDKTRAVAKELSNFLNMPIKE